MRKVFRFAGLFLFTFGVLHATSNFWDSFMIMLGAVIYTNVLNDRS